MLDSRKRENDAKSAEVIALREKVAALSETIKQLEADYIKKQDATSHENLKQS